MADQLFIGIDSGTQGCKVVVFSSERGEIISQGNSPHTLLENPRGGREQDPTNWVEAMGNALYQAFQGIDRRWVRAISVSGQQHGFVPLDENGSVIRLVKLWCDTETEPECQTLMEGLGGGHGAIEATGNAIATGFTVSKLLWLKEHEPDNYHKLHTILLPHDFLNYYLSGEMWTEHGDASGTGFYDVRKKEWSETVLSLIDSSRDLRQCLPPIKRCDEPCGLLRKELALEWGLPKNVLIVPGGGDNMMAAIGTGNVVNGVISASLGTSGTIYGFSSSPVIDSKGELAAFCSSTGGWLPLVCTMNVTVATELVRELFGLSLDRFNTLVDAASPGCDGLILLPFFNGERTPALPQASATLHGMKSTNFTVENICRAAMEGVTMGLRYGRDLLVKAGMSPKEIRLVGGGAKSKVWREMVANVFNVPVVSPHVTEAGAFGAALQAMWCSFAAADSPISIEELCERYVLMDQESYAEPVKEQAALYDSYYRRYLRLEKTLRPLNTSLAED